MVSAARESYSETRREGGGKMRSAVAKAPEATGAPADGCTALPSSVPAPRLVVVPSLLFTVLSARCPWPCFPILYCTLYNSHLFRGALLAF